LKHNLLGTARSTFVLVFTMVCAIASHGQPLVAVPDGYATQNGGTTGGGSATPVTVTTASAFKSVAENDDPAVIIVQGKLNVGNIGIGSNKTIIGADRNSGLYGGRVSVKGTNNIFQKLIIGPSNTDAMEVSGATNVFITKCEFYDGADGSLDIVRESDYVTVSWCKFYYVNQTTHKNTLMIGNSDDRTSDAGKLHVTLHHNWFAEKCDQRMPRVRYGHVHIYNNYYNSVGNPYCIGTGFECHIRLENTYFENTNNPWREQAIGALASGGEIDWNNLKFVNCVQPTYINNSYPVFSPPYQFEMDSVDDVKSLVTDPVYGAGNRLARSSVANMSNGNTIRIMPLGDSITAGEHYGYPTNGERIGYRKPLYELMVANAYDVNFVGSLHWGFDMTPPFDCDHEGWPGWQASQIAANVYRWLEQNPPDIILAHVGTNGLSADNVKDVEQMLNEIDRYEIDNDAEIIVFLARIIHRYEMDSSAITTAFNDNVEAMALSRVQNQGDKIIMVDMENGAGIDYMADGVDMLGTTYPKVSYDRYHPTDQGNTKMAKLWFEHLDIFLERYKARNPYPEDGSYLWPSAFTEFRWSIPAPRHPNDVVTCDVYIGMDPNTLKKIAADEPNDSLPSEVFPVIPETAYYWRVDCNDPNAGNPVITEGTLWTFHTFDPAPEIDAGERLYVRLPNNDMPAVMQMSATVTDEGDPNAVLYYLWSTESAPAGIPDDIFDDNTTEDPLVSFPADGEYILRLSVSDDGPVEIQESKDIVSDTVTITVGPWTSNHFRINCGGPTLYNGSEIWESDLRYLVEGHEGVPLDSSDWGVDPSKASNPAPDLVYESINHLQDWTNPSESIQYTFPVPEGKYTVRLHTLCEVRVGRSTTFVIEVAILEFTTDVTDSNGLQIEINGGYDGSNPGESDAWVAALEIITL